MATKKVETLYVVLDTDGYCFVDHNAEQNTTVEEVVFDNEKDAIDASKDSFDQEEWDDNETLTVFKLVPVALVKRAKSVVEKL